MKANPDQRRKFKKIFHMELPESLFEFWTFYNELEKDNLSLMRCPINIRLSNLFDLFAAADTDVEETYYFDDPPEWITLVDTVDMGGLHWGYFVESYPPVCLPIVSYSRGSYISQVGNDLFEALHDHLFFIDRSLRFNIENDKENEASYREDLTFIDQVTSYLQPKLGGTPPWNRQPKITTRDGYGIALDPSLYRPLPNEDRLLEPECQPTSDEIERWVRAAQESLEAGFPLTALKLGRDLWRYPQFLEISHNLLKLAYTQLGQQVLLDRLEYKHAFRKAGTVGH